MADREESPEAFAEAVTKAEREEERFGRATRRFLVRELRSQVRRIREEGKPGDGSVNEELEETDDDRDSPWRESLPLLAGEEAEEPVERIDETLANVFADCPIMEQAHTFLAELDRQAHSGEAASSVMVYLLACVSTAVVGVTMSRYWIKDRGFPLAQTARYAIAAERFATVARILETYPISGLEGMADHGRAISDGFRLAATAGPGGKHLS